MGESSDLVLVWLVTHLEDVIAEFLGNINVVAGGIGLVGLYGKERLEKQGLVGDHEGCEHFLLHLLMSMFLSSKPTCL